MHLHLNSCILNSWIIVEIKKLSSVSSSDIRQKLLILDNAWEATLESQEAKLAQEPHKQDKSHP